MVRHLRSEGMVGCRWAEKGWGKERSLLSRSARSHPELEIRATDVNSTLNHPSDAGRKIVFDKFHIATHLSEAVDRVRRRENKQLKARGNDRLAGTRYDWPRHPGKVDLGDREEFAVLRDNKLKTAKAALREEMMAFFEYFYERPARPDYCG